MFQKEERQKAEFVAGKAAATTNAASLALSSVLNAANGIFRIGSVHTAAPITSGKF